MFCAMCKQWLRLVPRSPSNFQINDVSWDPRADQDKIILAGAAEKADLSEVDSPRQC